MSPHNIAPPLTEQAADLERAWEVFLALGLAVGALVVAMILFAVSRNRRRMELPRQTREHVRLELGYTVVPLLIIVVLFVLTVRTVRAVDENDDPESADLVVDVVGFQWQWQFTYPATATGGEPLAITGTPAEDPVLVLPAESSVRFELRSIDVIHSFWIPGFRYKRDMFPDETTSFQVDVGPRTGTWPDGGVCAEFCGLDHHKMQFTVQVVAADDLAATLQELAAP